MMLGPISLKQSKAWMFDHQNQTEFGVLAFHMYICRGNFCFIIFCSLKCGVLDQHALCYLGFCKMSYFLQNLDWCWCMALVCCIGLDMLDMAPGGGVGRLRNHRITLVSDVVSGGSGLWGLEIWCKVRVSVRNASRFAKHVWGSCPTVIQFNRSCPVVQKKFLIVTRT